MKLAFRFFITLLLLSSIGLLSAVAATATGTAQIENPAGRDKLSGLVEIRGSALLDNSTPLNFQYYRLEYSRLSESAGTILLGSSIYAVQVRDGLLDTWDTTLVPNGTYLVRLQVFGSRGVIAETTTLVFVENYLPWLTEFRQKTA
jgi:hypothetical protein